MNEKQVQDYIYAAITSAFNKAVEEVEGKGVVTTSNMLLFPVVKFTCATFEKCEAPLSMLEDYYLAVQLSSLGN